MGVASALNQGFRWALEHGYHKIISFDQDSCPAPGMLPAMLNIFSAHNSDGKIAVVAPVIEDTKVKKRARFLRPKGKVFFEWIDCEDSILDNVTAVITSGALYDLKAYQQIGPFRDDFFIDYVDTEYCLRARQNGYKILVACNAFLEHRLGNQKKRFFLGQDHYPTFHSSFRFY